MKDELMKIADKARGCIGYEGEEAIMQDVADQLEALATQLPENEPLLRSFQQTRADTVLSMLTGAKP